MSTPRSRPAAAAPAWTLCQKKCETPFGMTAITRRPLAGRLHAGASTRQAQSARTKLFRFIVVQEEGPGTGRRLPTRARRGALGATASAVGTGTKPARRARPARRRIACGLSIARVEEPAERVAE